jgi:CubicO group peptidase (beta-lactamase class C family)
MTISGSCDSRFAGVGEEFQRNFAERGEVGASVCVMVDGERVVDLWGGVADPTTGRPWEEDTVCTVWSCTKGAAALCAHLLIDRGQLDPDALVVDYWPEYGQAGKEATTVRMLLSHQGGVAHVRTILEPGAFRDWDAMTALIAAETPFWEPGTRHGYHGHTFGWLVGELVRRIDGRSIGRFFAEEVAGPLGIDFWIGTPAREHHRIAPNQPPPLPDGAQPLPAFITAALTDPTSLAGLLLLNHGGFVAEPNGPENLEAEIPSGNGVTNGRGLAGMYNPLAVGGTADGVKLVGADSIARMGAVASAGEVDACLSIPSRFSLGFMKSITIRQSEGGEDVVAMSEAAFGHAGMGGALGFADPSARMSFGYAMNQQGSTMLLNDRGQTLVDATYRALGFTSRASGVWT